MYKEMTDLSELQELAANLAKISRRDRNVLESLYKYLDRAERLNIEITPADVIHELNYIQTQKFPIILGKLDKE